MEQNSFKDNFIAAVNGMRPDAFAQIRGSDKYPGIHGTVKFYAVREGTLVVTSVHGLPHSDGKCSGRFFAMHIHSGSQCSGNNEDPFAKAGTHFNPDDCPHPQHAGDLPPLLSNSGNAWYAVITRRFLVKDIIGRTAIIHAMPDDFTTQPAGNAGMKIACGVIRKAR